MKPRRLYGPERQAGLCHGSANEFACGSRQPPGPYEFAAQDEWDLVHVSRLAFYRKGEKMANPVLHP